MDKFTLLLLALSICFVCASSQDGFVFSSIKSWTWKGKTYKKSEYYSIYHMAADPADSSCFIALFNPPSPSTSGNSVISSSTGAGSSSGQNSASSSGQNSASSSGQNSASSGSTNGGDDQIDKSSNSTDFFLIRACIISGEAVVTSVMLTPYIGSFFVNPTTKLLVASTYVGDTYTPSVAYYSLPKLVHLHESRVSSNLDFSDPFFNIVETTFFPTTGGMLAVDTKTFTISTYPFVDVPITNYYACMSMFAVTNTDFIAVLAIGLDQGYITKVSFTGTSFKVVQAENVTVGEWPLVGALPAYYGENTFYLFHTWESAFSVYSIDTLELQQQVECPISGQTWADLTVIGQTLVAMVGNVDGGVWYMSTFVNGKMQSFFEDTPELDVLFGATSGPYVYWVSMRCHCVAQWDTSTIFTTGLSSSSDGSVTAANIVASGGNEATSSPSNTDQDGSSTGASHNSSNESSSGIRKYEGRSHKGTTGGSIPIY